MADPQSRSTGYGYASDACWPSTPRLNGGDDDVPMMMTSPKAPQWQWHLEHAQQKHPSSSSAEFWSSHRHLIDSGACQQKQPLGHCDSVMRKQQWPPLSIHVSGVSGADDQMQIQDPGNEGVYYCPMVDPETGFTILSISAMMPFRNKSHEEIRWECYSFRTDPMIADAVPYPTPSTKGLAALPPGPYYLVPASVWSPPPFVTPVVFYASAPAAVIHERAAFHGQAQSPPQQQHQQQPQQAEQELPNPNLTCKPTHPFGRLPQAQQPCFKSSSSSSAFPLVGKTSPLLMVPSRPVLRSRSRTKPQVHLPPPVVWDEPPPPDKFLTRIKNPRSLFISPHQNRSPPNNPRQQECSDKVAIDCGNKAQGAEPTTDDQEATTQISVPSPKVSASDYYIQPSLDEIRNRQLSTPGGYCHKVDNFVVGRKQHGEIRFIGQTDVRGLDVCDIVQFDKNQVFVYMDESKKPAVGDGLNKPAEVTLFNIHWNDKLPSSDSNPLQQQHQFEMMLRDEAHRQGSHFISYDAESGEWKFLVDHFSLYGLQLEEIVHRLRG